MRWLLLALLLVAAAAGRATADPPDAATLAEADRLLREGNAHYAAKRHAEAIAAYQRAYDLTGAPGFLFNIAQVHRVDGRCREAIDHYERFLAAEPKTPLRPRVERFVAELWRCVEAERRKEAEQPGPTAASTVPPTAASTVPPTAASTVPPPAAGVTPAGARRSASPSRWRWAGLGVAGLGVLAVAGGAYFGLEARSASREAERFTGEWGPEQERREEDAARDERNAIILLATGGAAIAGGAVLFVLLGHRGDSGEGAPLAVVPVGRGAALVWSGSLGL